MPTGVTFVSSSTVSGTYTFGTGIWTIGTITAFTTVTLTIDVTVDAGTGGSVITNTASITAVTEEDSDLTNNSADAIITIISITAIDVGITKTVNDPTPNVDDVITYTVRVTNNDSTIDATGVIVTDVVPTGVTLVFGSATDNAPTSTITELGSTITWDIGTIPPLVSFRLDFDARVNTGTAGTNIFNIVTITGLVEGDSDPSNNSAFAKITVDAIRTLKAELVGELEVERNISTDSRLIALLGRAINDILDSLNPLFYESDPILDRAHGNRVFHEEETAVRTLDRLLNKADACISVESFTVQYDNTLPVMILVTTDGISTVGIEQLPLATAILSPGDEIVVTPVGASLPTTSLTYDIMDTSATVLETITITDLCSRDAHEVFVDPVPVTPLFDLEIFDFEKTFSFNSGVVPSSTLEVVQRAIDEMVAADKGVALTIFDFASVTFGGMGDPKVDTELATATGYFADGDAFRAAGDIPKAIHKYEQAWHHSSLALASTGFYELPDLDIVKTVDDLDGEVTIGQTLMYTITVNNVGPLDVTGVEVTDLLPTGVTFVSSSTASGTYASGTGLWSGFDLISGATVTLVITGTVVGTVGDIIMNTVSYDTSSPIDTFPDDETVTVIVVP